MIKIFAEFQQKQMMGNSELKTIDGKTTYS